MEKKQALSNGAPPPPYSTTPNGQNEASDLAKLWSEAIRNYEKKTNQPLRLDAMNNLDEVMKGTEKEIKGFDKFRHDKGKTDKVRSAFKDNLGWIQKVVKAAEAVGKAAGAFPPAMPAGLIFCAFGQVMNSFNDMSADYDKIVDFFAFVRRFFERLSIIEEKTPHSPGFLKAVVYVFSNMLVIFAIAQQYSKEQGRFKKWIKNLSDGEDPALKQAYSNMEIAVNELSEAVGMETLKMTAFIAEIIHNMDKDVKILVSTTTETNEIVGITRAKTEVLVENSDIMVANQRADGEKLNNLQNMVERLLGKTNDPDGTKHLKKGKTDPAEKRRVALAEVKGYFNRSYLDFDMSAGIRGRRKHDSQTDPPVEGTGQWLFEEENYKLWASEDINHLLWVKGDAGVGKSFLSETIVAGLEKSTTIPRSCGSFFFREGQDGLPSFKHALCYLSVQIAEKNSNYLEELASALGTTADSDPWKISFAERFPSKGDAHAWLVLDGIDEMNEMERKNMTECLANISKKDLNIHVILVSRHLDEVASLNPLTITITKEKIEMDIQHFVEVRIEALPHLRRFRKHVKRVITRKIKNKADGMLYVEHMLRRLNYIGREKAVLKDIDKNLPNNMEDLYRLMLTECQTSITTEQYQIAKELFAWMAYSKRTLTREEAAHLCAITARQNRFDVDDLDVDDLVDEINSRSARLLEFNRGQAEEEEVDEKADDSSEADDPGFHIESEKTPLAFQERSLREYFRVCGTEENGLRTQPSTAHLAIFKTCGTLLSDPESWLEDETQPKLLDYAAKYFTHHLIEIDINSASDDEASKVVRILHLFLTNVNNFAYVMERFGTLYSKMAPDEKGTWICTVKKWAARYDSLNEKLLDVKVAQWAREIITSEQPFILLARGHVLNSFKACDGLRIANAFEYARDAFQLSDFDVTSNTLETVITIATHFSDIEMDAGSYRAISCALSTFQLPEESMKYVNKAFDILPAGNSALRFYLTRALFINHTTISQEDDKTSKKEYKNAVKYIDEAISALPSDWKSSKDLLNIVEYTYCQKAWHLIKQGKREEAIQAYDDCTAVRPGETKLYNSGPGLIFQFMMHTWDEENDPDASKSFKMLKGWTEEERLAWFEYILDLPTYDSDAIARLEQVAAKNGEEGNKFVLQCYHNFMETLQSKSAHNGQGNRDSTVLLSSSGADSNTMILAKAAMANVYRRGLRDDQKSKEIYVGILKHQSRDENLDLEWVFFEARRALTEIMFEEFRTSSDPTKKTTLLNEMKDHLTSGESDTGVFGIDGSNISILFAIMHRVLGSAEIFESTLKKAFNTCMGGLSDTVGWNDSSSFRLLAKVLACVEGLERDSLIALSCQYSKVTDEPAEDDDEVASEEDKAGSDPIEPKVEESTEGNTQVTSKEKLGDSTSHDNHEAKEKEPETENHDAPENTIHLTETTTTTTTRDDGVLTSSTKIIVEEATFTPENPEKSTSEIETKDPTTSKDISKDASKETTKPHALPPNPDEDLSDGYQIGCDGCGTFWPSWTEPQYLCIVCTCTDLCTACHEKQVLLKYGEPTPCCGIDHRYIKGPVEGWRGVKDGEMRILVNGEIENIKVSVWKEELKERWDQAWEKFWMRLEGVRDLGF